VLQPKRISTLIVWSTVLTALVGLTWSFSGLGRQTDWSGVPLIIAGAIAAEVLKLTIYEARKQTLSFTFSVATIMAAITVEPHFGPLTGLFAGVLHVLAARQRAPAKVALNIAILSVAASVASLLYMFLRPPSAGFGPAHLVAAGIGVIAYYVTNIGVVAAMVSLNSGRPYLTVVRESAWFGPVNVLLGLTGAFLGGIHELLGLMGALMFLVPLLLMRFTLGFYAARSQRTIRMLEAHADSLDHQARYDSLTDLPNRAEVQRRVEQRFAGDRQSPLALLLVDLDRFKEINDLFGFETGDLVLQQTGRRLQAALSADDLVGRLGADQFVVVLPSAGAEQAGQTAERLLQAFQAPFTVKGHRLDLGASIGVALAPEHGTDPATLLRRADVATYVAKRHRGGYALYEPRDDEFSPERLALLGDLRAGLQRGEIVLYVQPQIDLRKGRVVGGEALVRWQHPELGLIAPNVFIPLAEHSGLIKPLTRYMLEAALRACRGWLNQGLNLSISVNVSVQDLHDQTFPSLVCSLLELTNVPARHLCVEVTEGAVMDDVERGRGVLQQLRAMEVGVSIDDFGTGYSSLSYLKNLPVTELKLDRSFVQHLATDVNDAAIVRSTVSLGHDLGLTVVAEGAEDLATLTRLSQLGCDQVQGFIFSKPIPAADFGAWVEKFSAPYQPELVFAAA
jgi:diguanylate cyclase (GGDEF)-like protein